MLEAVCDHVPSLFHFVHSAYASPTFLFWQDRIIQSSEGVQQGDPLGPLLFCLSIHKICALLKSELCIFYLNDLTIGGETDVVIEDLKLIEGMATELGLQLNHCKSEVICRDHQSTVSTIISYFPGARVINSINATLLGSPLGDVASISAFIDDKVLLLKKLGAKLEHLLSHDAILLRYSFSIPKLIHIMRSSPSFLSMSLKSFDDEMRSIVSGITNTLFDANDVSWKQATLPVKDGGLGFRSAVHVAPSAYLASAESSSDLAHCILPPHFGSCPLLHYDEAITMWSQSHDQTPPVGSEVYKQKCWYAPRVSSLAKSLLDAQQKQIDACH